MKTKVWVNLLWRKATSACTRILRKAWQPRVNRDGEIFLGRFAILEVLVPLTMGENDLLYVSNRLIDDLQDWKQEICETYHVQYLTFRLEEASVQPGWDSVTGMWGRVVNVDVFGVTRSPMTLRLDHAMDLLNDAAMNWQAGGYAVEDRKRMQKFTREIGQLLKERRRKQGNVRHNISFHN